MNEAMQALLRHPAIWRGSGCSAVALPSIPSGHAALDAALPGGGWPVGTLTEILPQHEGIGEVRILGPALARLSQAGRWLVWIAPPYLPYAPALTAAGIDLARLIIVKTQNRRDAFWALEQALRSNACGAVLGWMEPVPYPELRRLQLAGEGTNTLAILFRPPWAVNASSPAALRISLQTAAGNLAATIVKRRGGAIAEPILLQPEPAADSKTNSDKLASHVMDRALFSAAPPGSVAACAAF